MKVSRRIRVALFALTGACLVSAAARVDAADWKFDVRFSKDAHGKPFTGRVYVIMTKSSREPRLGPSWFRPETFIARDVVDWKPDETISLSNKNVSQQLSYPGPLDPSQLAGYRAQVVVRFNPLERTLGKAAGNGYSQVVKFDGDTDFSKTDTFVVDKVVKPTKFKGTKWTKLLDVKSELLSKFHKRDVSMKAAVILPASYYKESKRRYPTIFTIPGFGGTHFRGITDQPINEMNEKGVEFIRVLLDPSCPLGHHVFADSANNGPVGQALISELIPALDRKFRSIAEPNARFLTGHSSGGWSSLWLQVTYPDFFGGTWSTAPDPVDFRDFQRINLYKQNENMYVDADGKQRPLARVRGKVLLWYKGFAEMEWVLGPGGQLHSFEAVFSPRGPDGKPLLIWDRKTGIVDTRVTKTWEKYDIRLKLERNWKTLGPKLKGKLHVFMGDVDTFYLEGATILLKKSLEELGSDAVVEIHKGKDHSSIMTAKLRNRLRSEMVTAFLSKFPNQETKNQ